MAKNLNIVKIYIYSTEGIISYDGDWFIFDVLMYLEDIWIYILKHTQTLPNNLSPFESTDKLSATVSSLSIWRSFKS